MTKKQIDDFLGMGEIIKDQTAEIERLGELLWQEAGNRVEIERLRTALREIEQWDSHTSLSEPRLIARRALEPKP